MAPSSQYELEALRQPWMLLRDVEFMAMSTATHLPPCISNESLEPYQSVNAPRTFVSLRRVYVSVTMPLQRIAHSKSRYGCSQCKERRLKVKSMMHLDSPQLIDVAIVR